jgi:integrase
VERFVKMALGTGYPLDEALTRYLEERQAGNRLGLQPLSKATVNDVRTAVRYLKTFMGENGDALCLQDIGPQQAKRFRYDFLPKVTSARAPSGLSAKTTAKHITLLSGLWAWAGERGFLMVDHVNPWQMPRGIRKSKSNGEENRSLFRADQVTALFSAFRQGDKLGDIMRLALLTGCRSDELATLPVDAVEKDAAGFRIKSGKTENAPRYVPLTEPAQRLIQRRLHACAQHGRVFPEWPMRESSGKASALPQAFTRARRKVLGKDTDGVLAFHSFRHTWRTVARWAGVREEDANELGGWAGARTSSSVYDHGLLEEQLREAQEQVTGMMKAKGFLEAF